MTSSIWNLLKKEFRSFFNTPVGYIVLTIFFVGAGLFLWIFPGEYNVLNSGYANIDGLFVLAPWLFLFYLINSLATYLGLFLDVLFLIYLSKIVLKTLKKALKLFFTYPTSFFKK
jgi:ABC-type transport system involved in multi-copper enzyme maturation permease subunit